MRIAVTGATGLVGRFLVEAALAAGHEVAALSRHRPAPGFFSRPVEHLAQDLDSPPPPLAGFDALIHAGFAHVPGRYRGGEGDDPKGFLRRNAAGTEALFDAARKADLPHVVFLSSRAVHDGHLPGSTLADDTAPRPTDLYGEVKVRGETALARLAPGFATAASLRATGVYGAGAPGAGHKWTGLFRDFRDGAPIAPRRGTEVHGADLAAAALLVIGAGGKGAFNVSDLLLDRRDLLADVARLTGWTAPLPAPAANPVSVLDCPRLLALGWRPRGLAGLRAELPLLLAGL